MSTNHGMDESDVIEIVSNNRPAQETVTMHAGLAVAAHDGNAAESYEVCKAVGEYIRDEIVMADAAKRHRMPADRENTLTESLFARMRGCVDWAEVGRHFITVAMEETQGTSRRAR